MKQRLADKVAVITGGTSGIGLASVELFLEEGARVVIGDLRDGPGAALQDRYPNRVAYVHTDVTDDAAIGRLVQSSVDHFGKLDVIFNNAGAVGDPSPLEELGAEGLDRTLKLLVQSVVSGHKYATRQFRKQGTGGSIISTASAAGLQGAWGPAAYTIAKHAVVGVVRHAAAELGPLRIRSNAVCPGVIMTPIMASAFGVPYERTEEFEEFLANRLTNLNPIGRVGRPRDVAQAVAFLASDAAAFITGVTLPVDGGANAVMMGSFAADATQAANDFLAT